MDLKNLKLIKEFLEIPIELSVSYGDDLNDFNWDSLAIINIQSFFLDHNGSEINPEELDELKNIGDLDKFLSHNLK